MFWRRRIWDKAGGQIDESFQFALDWDLLLRFRAGRGEVRPPAALPRRVPRPRRQKTSADLVDDRHARDGASSASGCTVSDTNLEDIRKNMAGYMLRHAWHNWLYRLGLSRP